MYLISDYIPHPVSVCCLMIRIPYFIIALFIIYIKFFNIKYELKLYFEKFK